MPLKNAFLSLKYLNRWDSTANEGISASVMRPGVDFHLIFGK